MKTCLCKPLEAGNRQNATNLHIGDHSVAAACGLRHEERYWKQQVLICVLQSQLTLLIHLTLPSRLASSGRFRKVFWTRTSLASQVTSLKWALIVIRSSKIKIFAQIKRRNRRSRRPLFTKLQTKTSSFPSMLKKKGTRPDFRLLLVKRKQIMKQGKLRRVK